MKKYAVTIVATIQKTIEVLAENAEQAAQLASQEFTAANDGTAEKYTEEVTQVKP
jgi:hypothetical protein